MQVYFKENGLADFVSGNGVGWIEINRNLKKYPYAYSKTLEHEISHSKSNGVFDIWLEIKQFIDLKLIKQLFLFTITHPKSWNQFSPISKTIKGNYSLNFFIMLVMVMVLMFVGAMVYGVI